MYVDPSGILRFGEAKVLLDDSVNGNDEELVVAATATSRNNNSSFKKINESMISDFSENPIR